jgi:hypothetical protein
MAAPAATRILIAAFPSSDLAGRTEPFVRGSIIARIANAGIENERTRRISHLNAISVDHCRICSIDKGTLSHPSPRSQHALTGTTAVNAALPRDALHRLLDLKPLELRMIEIE